MEVNHTITSQPVDGVLLNTNDEAETAEQDIQFNIQSLPDTQTYLRYDKADNDIKAAQAALTVAKAAVARLHIHDYLTQNVELLEQQASQLYEEAAGSIEKSRDRLYKTSLEDIPVLPFQTMCQFLDYKDTANMRLTSKTVLYLHKYTEDHRFKVCHLTLDVKTDFSEIDCQFLRDDFQFDITFNIEQKKHTNYVKLTRNYDLNFARIHSFLFTHKERIRRLSMDSYIYHKHIGTILNIPKLQHLTLNKDFLMCYNYKHWDQPPLHNILLKNCDHLKKIDVSGVDLETLRDVKYPLKNLSVLTIGQHCIYWEKFVSSIMNESGNNLTALDLFASNSFVTSDFSVTSQLPKLTSLTLHKFNFAVLRSILSKCCSTIKYLNIQFIDIEPTAIPMMPNLETINMNGVTYDEIAAIAYNIPNVKEIKIGEVKWVGNGNATPRHHGEKLLQLSVIKIWNKNHYSMMSFMYYIIKVAPNLRYVYVRSAESFARAERFFSSFLNFNVTVYELESETDF